MSMEPTYDATVEMMPVDLNSIVYKLNDGRFWSVADAKYITESEIPAGAQMVELYANGKPAGEEYLIKCIDFYHFKYGELLSKSVEGIKEALNALDEKYLTPRTIAGLSVNDSTAKTLWDKHEEEAAPLRKMLEDLQGPSEVKS